MKSFYSNGKLLLTGEYVVLDGAQSLALPTTYGQTLTVRETESPKIIWKSLNYNGELWFKAVFDLAILKHTPEKLRFSSLSQEENTLSQTLSKILIEAKKMNPKFLNNATGYEVETKLDFPNEWGLGTSSTLVNNIARWAKVDAYELLWKTFTGSGYDIACANHNRPLLYQLQHTVPKIKEIDFDPPFKNQLFFVYLNEKQNSREGISQYRNQRVNKDLLIRQISKITQEVIACDNLQDFEALICRHETLLSEVLKVPTVKERLFSDYYGTIKSLGAWGGDFMLTTGDRNTPRYFNDKGYGTVIPFSKMVLI